MKSLPRVAGHTLTASQALPRQQGLNGNGVQTNPPTPQSLSTPRHDRPRIAFLTHLIGPDSLRHFDPGLADLSDPALRRFSERVRRHPWMIDYYDFTLRSPTGAAVDASLVGWLTFPEHFAHATASGGGHHFVPLMHEAIDELVAEGVHWIGLGGFTSIVSAAGRRLVRADAHITTGNSLTVAMGLEALAAAARERHIDLRSATVAVVGALGNVGRTYSELLADSVGELILVGRPSNDSRLAHFAESLLAKQQGGAGSTRIRWTTDPAELRSAQAILSASNAPSPIIHPDHVGRAEVIISDVALPGDVSPAVAEERPNATLIRGGIVRLPSEGGESPVDLPGFQLQPGQCYACLAETLLLALEGWHEDYSCGPISALAVRRIAALASRHRFELDSPKISHST